MKNYKEIVFEDGYKFKEIFFSYLSFWRFYVGGIIIGLIIATLYLRYSENIYLATTKVEIIDKAQDSEMALPTEMTIFNRSMINLENEMGVLNSYTLNEIVVKKLKSNVKFYTVGRIKISENHRSEFFQNYDLNFKIDTDSIIQRSDYVIKIINKTLNISFQENGINKEYNFKNLSTYETDHPLPFDISVLKYDDLFSEKIISFQPLNETVFDFMQNLSVSPSSRGSDQLILSMKRNNYIIAEEYLNVLNNEFDLDGIGDRQEEYRLTMDFVDTRAVFLAKELEQIEIKKQNFKEKNNLSDVSKDASINVDQQLIYDSELFVSKSQLDLIMLLETGIFDEKYKLLPIDIGIKDNLINSIIVEYNAVIKERDKYLLSVGKNNPILVNIDSQIDKLFNNLIVSIKNYKSSLNRSIKNLELKEREFESFYRSIPEIEKVLRSIDRELEIKEALFLLLLQKREEASINLAVVKPSIKVIDVARSSRSPISPIPLYVYLLSIFFGFSVPILFVIILRTFNTKVQSKSDILDVLRGIPIVGEIPNILNNKSVLIEKSNSRSTLAESLRMVITNFNFLVTSKNKKAKVILVTSSIKGEGKTLVSSNLAALISKKNIKTLLIGADLRNPQIHKLINKQKSVKGLSDYIFKENIDYKDLIVKYNFLDIILSGTIPPNPNELLSSKKFKNFIDYVSEIYDYIIIDSAPCLVVSDTFEIPNEIIDFTLYVVRANHTEKSILEYIKELNNEEKLSKINIILNAVGASKTYGYKYGYQYGYNYGYGYGYNED